MSGELEEFIASGILESYVLGMADREDAARVLRMAAQHAEVRQELAAIEKAIGKQSRKEATVPDRTAGPFLEATINYTERIKAGEPQEHPPLLTGNSRIHDYAKWLSRPDLQPRQPVQDIFARIIGSTVTALTAIVWLKTSAPPEVHDTLLERFLVVEGGCEIVINGQALAMGVGDILTIPLHASHHIRVTSAQPCKVILQRVHLLH